MQTQTVPNVRDALSSILNFAPSFLAGLIVLVLGAVAWWLVARLVGRLLVLLRLDRLMASTAWGRALSKGDVRHALFDLTGTILGALVFLLFLDNALQLWHLTVVVRLLEGLVLLIPQLVVAGIVLLIGVGVGGIAERSARRTFSEAGLPRALLLARSIRAAILVLASAIALIELDLASQIVAVAFFITFGSLGVAFVLAVGLGSRRAVERMWDDVLSRRQVEHASAATPREELPAGKE